MVGDHIPPNRLVWGSSKELVPPGLQKQLARSFGFASPGRTGKGPRYIRPPMPCATACSRALPPASSCG